MEPIREVEERFGCEAFLRKLKAAQSCEALLLASLKAWVVYQSMVPQTPNASWEISFLRSLGNGTAVDSASQQR